MQIKVTANSFFIFDLDDTLYCEIDFLKSAYRHIAQKLVPYVKADLYNEMLRRYKNMENVFEWIVKTYQHVIPGLNKEGLLKEYHEHSPDITLCSGTFDFLNTSARLSIPAGLITDGRSITQRNKLRALTITSYFKDIIISEEFGSEKPDEKNYLYFQHKYPNKDFYFFGDNTSKDFIVPARLGWTTVCLKDSGYCIHPQNFSQPPVPDFTISSFEEIELCYRQHQVPLMQNGARLAVDRTT